MVFAPQDLLADPPLTGLHLVTCRNLLIYLDTNAARRVVHPNQGQEPARQVLSCAIRAIFLSRTDDRVAKSRA
jgi:hypothetical protein